MRDERHRDNFIKVNGFIEYGKKLIFIVINLFWQSVKKSAKESCLYVII